MDSSKQKEGVPVTGEKFVQGSSIPPDNVRSEKKRELCIVPSLASKSQIAPLSLPVLTSAPPAGSSVRVKVEQVTYTRCPDDREQRLQNAEAIEAGRRSSRPDEREQQLQDMKKAIEAGKQQLQKVKKAIEAGKKQLQNSEAIEAGRSPSRPDEREQQLQNVKKAIEAGKQQVQNAEAIEAGRRPGRPNEEEQVHDSEPLEEDGSRSRSDEEQSLTKRRRRSTGSMSPREVYSQNHVRHPSRAEGSRDRQGSRREQRHQNLSDVIHEINSSSDDEEERLTRPSKVHRRGDQVSHRDFLRERGREKYNSDGRYGSQSRRYSTGSLFGDFHSRHRRGGYDETYDRHGAARRRNTSEGRQRSGVRERRSFDEIDDAGLPVDGRRSHREFSRVVSRNLDRELQRRQLDKDLLTTSLLVNEKGEPQEYCATVVIEKLAEVVRRYVPLGRTWNAVTPEVKYQICVKLQSKFKDGFRLDNNWIKRKARSLHISAVNKAKDDLFARARESANRPQQGSPWYTLHREVRNGQL